ncbi:MAG: methyltransferase domain-containing protein [Nanoarchaeota archaeon]
MDLHQLKLLEQQSIKRGIPILNKEKSIWLLKKIKELRPQKILELGTANGYSGIILGSEGAELTTIEINEKIAEEAKENFVKFAIKAEVIVGDGVEIAKKEIVKKLRKEKKEYYDLIFIDFSKRDYIKVLEDCIELTKKNGFIIADNVNMEKCKEFKDAILNHPQLKTEIIEIKDGISCSEKIK